MLEYQEVVARISDVSKDIDDDEDDDDAGPTVLHIACYTRFPINRPAMLRLLLAAGADPCLRNENGHTPLQMLRNYYPDNVEAVAVLEKEVPDALRAACLIRIRQLVVAERGVTRSEEKGGVRGKKATMLAAVVGLAEGRRGFPKDLFVNLTDYLLPVWSTLRRGMGE